MKFLYIVLFSFGFIACKPSNTNEAVNTDSDSTAMEVDSLQFLSEQIQKNAFDATAWADRAQYFFRIGNVKDAKHDFEEAILRDSTNAAYRSRYADVLIAFLDLSGAKYNYEYALKYDSLNARAYVGLGHIYALIDNPGMATVYLNKAYGINRNLPEAYFLEGLIYRADFDKTKREESWKRSKSSFQTATELDPDYYEAFLMLGDMNSAEDNDLAIDYYASAIDIAPKSSQAWYAKGGYYQNHEKYEQAKYCYRKILSFDSTYFDAVYNQGYIQLTIDKDFDSAIYFFEKSIVIDSLSARAYNNLGLAQEYKGDNAQAIASYKKALEIDPKFELAEKNLRIVTNK
jgi:tetratricopeptide (TPR) repeat protein